MCIRDRAMEVHFSPDLQTKLNRVAAENSSDTDAYVQQLVEHYLDHDAWFRQNVNKGLEQLDRGEYLTHEEVGAVSYTHLRAHETVLDLVCRLLLEKKKK